MGICCINPVNISSKKIIGKCTFNQCTIELIQGNIIYEPLDGIVIPGNPVLKIPVEFLNCQVIQIQKTCVKQVKVNGKLTPGEIFVTNGVCCKHIVHAVCPFYSDGTLGEPDYLKSAFTSALQYLSSLNALKIGISLDWVYPKSEFSKIIIEVLIKFQCFSSISVFSLEPQIVIPK